MKKIILILGVLVMSCSTNPNYENNLNRGGRIFLSGRNSQHKNLVEIIGNSLKMDVAVISPINIYSLKEFAYNPDEINQFSMARFIGLGLTLIKSEELEDESINNEFIKLLKKNKISYKILTNLGHINAIYCPNSSLDLLSCEYISDPRGSGLALSGELF